MLQHCSSCTWQPSACLAGTVTQRLACGCSKPCTLLLLAQGPLMTLQCQSPGLQGVQPVAAAAAGRMIWGRQATAAAAAAAPSTQAAAEAAADSPVVVGARRGEASGVQTARRQAAATAMQTPPRRKGGQTAQFARQQWGVCLAAAPTWPPQAPLEASLLQLQLQPQQPQLVRLLLVLLLRRRGH